jgi:hypothetical protein
MIFAHGPLGFLSGLGLRPLARRLRLTQRQQWWLLATAFIGGIFPDSDFFYYYLVDASVPHRELITHTPFLYILIDIGLLGALLALKRRRAALFVGAFILGAFTHLATDTVLSEIMLFYPFSREFYGFTDLPWPVLTENLLFLNLFLEGTVYTLFGYALLRLLVKKPAPRLALTVALLALYASGTVGLLTARDHLYTPPKGAVYEDLDQDGLRNYQDPDVDNDGQANLADLDANNDGIGNVEQVMQTAERFVGTWYDPSHNGLLQIPARLGFVNTEDIPFRLYAPAGIHLAYEMEQDYAEHPEGYELDPTRDAFDRRPANLLTWLSHTGRKQTGEALYVNRTLIGDILFFESGHIAVATGFTAAGEPVVLDIHPDRPSAERELAEVIALEGELTARGHLLDSAPLFPTPVPSGSPSATGE